MYAWQWPTFAAGITYDGRAAKQDILFVMMIMFVYKFDTRLAEKHVSLFVVMIMFVYEFVTWARWETR